MNRRFMGIVALLMVMVAVFTGCDPNGGNKGNDENAFRIPSDMKKFAGTYTIMLPGDPNLGTEDSPAGTLTITDGDITAMLDLAGSKAPIFGTYESLREFYEFARKADPDNVMINGDIGSYHLFKISSVQYEFYWYDSGEVKPRLVIRDTMSGKTTIYNLKEN